MSTRQSDSAHLCFHQGQQQNEDGNSRHASLSEEEENLAVLRRWGIGRSSLILNQTMVFLFLFNSISQHAVFSECVLHVPFRLFCLQTCYERTAWNWESLRGGAALCAAGDSSHRGRLFLTSFKVFGFGLKHSCFIHRDMPQRWIILGCLISSPRLWITKRRFCLETCQKFTTSTKGDKVPPGCQMVHRWWHNVLLCHRYFDFSSQDFPERVGTVHRLPGAGWKVFPTEGGWRKDENDLSVQTVRSIFGVFT